MISKMISKCQIKLRHGLTLHPRRHMRIDVHRDRDCRMAQSLLHHLRMNAAGKQLRCMGVAKIVEAHAREATYAPNQICELMGEASWLLGLAINPPANQRVARLANTQRQECQC